METVKLFFNEAWVLISSISWRDFIDIALVTIILFFAFRFIRDRRAGKLIVGVVLLVAVQVLSEICGLGTINFLLGNFFEVGVLAIIILFQPELRSALEKVGSEPLRSLKMIGEKNSAQKRNQLVDSVCEACCQMAKEKTGALIVFERKTKLGEHINSGTVINADPSAPMIENVFFKNSPLHDGALVIRNDRLYAAGCFLPLSSNDDFRELGTRHHAAVGVSEVSDAVVIVVSEQTGTISVALEGKLRRNLDYVSLKRLLVALLIGNAENEKSGKGKKKDRRKIKKPEEKALETATAGKEEEA